MGTCLSSVPATSVTQTPPTAKVIAPSGDLFEFSSAIKSSLLLDPSSSFFICNSDHLFYDEHIPALGPEGPVLPGQLYFVLPAQKLEVPLTGDEMAALARWASSALLKSWEGGTPSGKKAKFMRPAVTIWETRNRSLMVKFRRGQIGLMKKKARNRSTRVRIAPASCGSKLDTIEDAA